MCAVCVVTAVVIVCGMFAWACGCARSSTRRKGRPFPVSRTPTGMALGHAFGMPFTTNFAAI